MAQAIEWLAWATVCLWWLGGCSPGPHPIEKPDGNTLGSVSSSDAGGADAELAGPKDPSQWKTLSDQLLAYWWRDIEWYRRYTKDPPEVRPAAEKFMRTVQLGMLPQARGPGRGQTVEMGKRLLEQGSKDPLVKAYYGEAVATYHGEYPALRIFVDAAKVVRPPDYPAEYRVRTVLFLFGRGKQFAKRVTTWPRLRKEAAAYVSQILRDPSVPPAMRRALFNEIRPLMGKRCGDSWEDALAIHEACKSVPQIDPWLLHMVAGVAYHELGWHHRGRGFAHTVSAEGWKLFSENLKKAAEHFTKAWELQPTCPEAADYMIKVAMADSSDQSPEQWWERAVAAQFDYMPAYYSLLWALRPRWLGSHEAMFRFGCRCAETKRIETPVPFVLIDALNDIDEEQHYDGEIWRREGVYDRVKEVLEAMARHPDYADGSGQYPHHSSTKTIHLALAARAWRLEDARRLADELQDRLDRWTLHKWQRHPEAVLAEVYAFTGKGAPYLDEAWAILRKAPRPAPPEALQKSRDLLRKALEADPHEYSQAYGRAMVTELEGQLAFSAGKWFERKFDPKLLAWRLAEGVWSQESETRALGTPRWGAGNVLIFPGIRLLPPIEVEFDIELVNPPTYPVTHGTFLVANASSKPSDESTCRFFLRTRSNEAGIELKGKSIKSNCEAKSANHFRVQVGSGQAALYVNDRLCAEYKGHDLPPDGRFYFGCLEGLYEGAGLRLSNVRMRRWQPETQQPISKSPSAPPTPEHRL